MYVSLYVRIYIRVYMYGVVCNHVYVCALLYIIWVYGVCMYVHVYVLLRICCRISAETQRTFLVHLLLRTMLVLLATPEAPPLRMASFAAPHSTIDTSTCHRSYLVAIHMYILTYSIHMYIQAYMHTHVHTYSAHTCIYIRLNIYLLNIYTVRTVHTNLSKDMP